MGRQSRTKHQRRSDAGTAYVAFAPYLTRRAFGAARLVMSRADVATIEELVSDASPAAHAHFAAWDAEGVGVTMETAAYDIANVATHAIQELRTVHPGIAIILTQIQVLLGDREVTLNLHQERKGGDVITRIAGTRQHAWDEDDEAVWAFLGRSAKADVAIFTAG